MNSYYLKQDSMKAGRRGHRTTTKYGQTVMYCGYADSAKQITKQEVPKQVTRKCIPVGSNHKNRKNNFYKVELCRSVFLGKPCQYGNACNYAHHQKEMRLATFGERDRADMIPYNVGWGNFRTRPCPDYVATGNCPFGARCTGIHDPRAAGPPPPVPLKCIEYAESSKNNLSTTIHVDYRLKTKISELNYGGPFGSKTEHILSDYDTFTQTICNKSSASRGTLSQAQRLQIALSFEEGRVDGPFIFKADHIIYQDYPCQVLAQKIFDTRFGDVQEISDRSRAPLLESIVTVTELAFNQEVDRDGTIPAPALWFNIPSYQIIKADDEDIKKLKRIHKGNGEPRPFAEAHSDSNSPFLVFYTDKSHCGLRGLIPDILRHEHSAVSTAYRGNAANAIDNASNEKIALESRFKCIRNALMDQHWEATLVGEKRRLEHRVPDVQGKYTAPRKGTKHWLWESFSARPWEPSVWNLTENDLKTNDGKPRLRSLMKLSKGEPLSSLNVKHPRISHDPFFEKFFNEWTMVIDHKKGRKQ